MKRTSAVSGDVKCRISPAQLHSEHAQCWQNFAAQRWSSAVAVSGSAQPQPDSLQSPVLSAQHSFTEPAHPQADCLRHLFVLGVNVARERSRAGAEEADLRVAAAAMALLAVVLEWDFRHFELPAAAAAAIARSALNETAQVRTFPEANLRRNRNDSKPLYLASASNAQQSCSNLRHFLRKRAPVLVVVSGNLASVESWGSFASIPQQSTSARFCRLLRIATECLHVQLGARWLSMLLTEMHARIQHIIALHLGAAALACRCGPAKRGGWCCWRPRRLHGWWTFCSACHPTEAALEAPRL